VEKVFPVIQPIYTPPRFDKDGRINEIALGGSTKVQTLTYDNASRITHLTETGLSAKTYGYDSDNRLTGFVNGTATILRLRRRQQLQ
jgi:YD repeat-containing protein